MSQCSRKRCARSGDGLRSERIGRDIRYGLRLMRKTPGFSAVAILSLALGIGANTAIFGLIDALLLKSLPVRDPKSLLFIAKQTEDHADPDFYYETYQRLRAAQTVFPGNCGVWRARADERERRWRGGIDHGPARVRELLRGAGRDARGGPRLHGGGRSRSRRASGGSDQLCILAAAVRGLGRRDRKKDVDRWNAIHDRWRDAARILRTSGGRCAGDQRSDHDAAAGDARQRELARPRTQYYGLADHVRETEAGHVERACHERPAGALSRHSDAARRGARPRQGIVAKAMGGGQACSPAGRRRALAPAAPVC